MAGNICDCCGIFGTVGVASSRLGAISFAYCKKCLQFGAEPEFMIRYIVEINGGWNKIADWVRCITIPIGPGIYIFADQLI